MRKSLRKSNARFCTISHDFGENFSFFLWYLLGFSEEKAPKFVDNSLIFSALLEA